MRNIFGKRLMKAALTEGKAGPSYVRASNRESNDEFPVLSSQHSDVARDGAYSQKAPVLVPCRARALRMNLASINLIKI